MPYALSVAQISTVKEAINPELIAHAYLLTDSMFGDLGIKVTTDVENIDKAFIFNDKGLLARQYKQGAVKKVQLGTMIENPTKVILAVTHPQDNVQKYREKEPFHVNPDGTNNAEKTTFLGNMKDLVRNDQLLIVVIATVIGTICVTGRYGILVYHVIYVVGGPQYIATMFTAMTVGQLVGTLTVPWGTKVFGKKNYMIIMNVVMAAGFVALFLNPTNNPVFLIGASFIGSLGFGAPAICYGMVGDSLEYGDWKLGKRQEGLAASMLSFGVKLATAICAPVILLLEAVGYVPNVEQTASAKMGINFMVNMLPAILALVSCIPLIWYKLSDKRVAEIREDLEAGKHKWDK